MDVTIHLLWGRGGQPLRVPDLPCSRWGLHSTISHLMDWCAFTAPFHLYNVLKRCSLLSVALSIASPLLGVTQHPALRSPDFPHPDGNTTIETRPSTQLKSFYYTLFNNLIATKSRNASEVFSYQLSEKRLSDIRFCFQTIAVWLENRCTG